MASGSAPPEPAGIRTTSYRFPCGIPAFEHHTRFRLIEDPMFSPIVLLESEIDPAVVFACAPVSLFASGYQIELSPEELEILGRPQETARLRLLAILTFRQGQPPTANLLAPVVLNPESLTGVQSVQWSSSWSHLHPVGEASPCS